MKRFLAVLLVVSLIGVTGCNSNKNDEQLNIDTGLNVKYKTIIDSELITADGYNDTVCVVPVDNVTSSTDAKISSRTGLIYNITDNKALYSQNIYQKMYPAATTSIMTAYCAIKYAKEKNIDLSSQTTVSGCVKDLPVGSGVSGFGEGDKVVIEDLIYCIMLGAGNDSALILAEAIAGDVNSFVELMNYEARRIGATNTHFAAPNGLHNENHYTTAYDMYLILNEAAKYPEFLEYFSKSTYEFNYNAVSGIIRKTMLTHTNRYMNGNVVAPSNINIIGGKTGYITESGRCLAMLSQDADENKYISIILYSDNNTKLYSDMNTLLRMAVD